MKIAFAKDIPFSPKSKRAISPVTYENKILDICQDHGWRYSGFILPVKTPFQNTKVLIHANGKDWTPLLQHVLYGSFKAVGQTKPPVKKFSRTEAEHLQVAQEFYDKHGFDVLGCAEPYKGVDTHLILRCHCHGKIHTKGDLHNNRRQGGLTCPIVRGALKAVQNGKKQVIRNKDANRPMYFYIFRVGSKFFKYGITTRSNPLQRMREHQKNTRELLAFEYSYKFERGWQAGDLETGIKKNIRGKKIPQKIFTSGYTETLPIQKLSSVKTFINEYISLNPTEPKYFVDPFEDIQNPLTLEEIEKYLSEIPVSDYDTTDPELDLEPLTLCNSL